jgi:DNA-directed RNA polymerase delta subunit
MKLNELTKEDLEAMGYDDIAYLILSENGAKLTLPELFKEICNLLDLSESEYESKIADFFQLMSTDHRFIMLPKGFWDLKTRHQSKVIIENDDDEELTPEETEDDTDMTEPEDEEETSDYYDDDDDDETDPTSDDDDLKDLVIINEDEDEANTNL